VDVGSITDVSEIHAASIFRVRPDGKADPTYLSIDLLPQRHIYTTTNI
jgi:hypothetical protein